jgi:hypothetical protein
VTLFAAGLLIVSGTVLAVYGLFALVFRGDESGGASYVMLAGRHVDADLADAISLGVGLVVSTAGVLVLTQRRD